MATYAIQASLYGLGAPGSLPTPLAAAAIEYNTLWEIAYLFSISIAKSAIGISLLRISIKPRHRRAVWTLLVGCNTAYGAGVLYEFAACRPFAARWNVLVGSCGGDNIMPILGVCLITLAAVTDAGYVVLPIDILRELQMPARLKYTLMAVMALGGSAAIFAVAQYPFAKYFPPTYGNTRESTPQAGGSDLRLTVSKPIVIGCRFCPRWRPRWRWFSDACR